MLGSKNNVAELCLAHYRFHGNGWSDFDCYKLFLIINSMRLFADACNIFYCERRAMIKGGTMNKRELFKRFLLYFFVMMFLLAVGCSGGGGDSDSSSDETNNASDQDTNDQNTNEEFPFGTWVNESKGISFTITSCVPCADVGLTCDPWEYCYGNIKYESHTVNLPGNEKTTELLLVNTHNNWMTLGGDENEIGSWMASINCQDDYATVEATCLVMMPDESFADNLTFIRQ